MPKLAPIHPGEILREEFLAPLGLSASDLAEAIHVPVNRITRLLKETSRVSPDTALRLSTAFRTTPEFWLNLQSRHDLLVARAAIRDLKKIDPLVSG